ncbi:MAG: STAS domain-containing protein [Saprospiraceae bacterium]|nr:STAS domain-containing protein [Saprospiraceae bacterium]
MKFSIDKKDRYTVLSVNEENLNTLNAPHLKSEFVMLHNEGVKNLILDLKDVKYVDSSGLSSILTANRLWEGNGTLVLTNVVNENVKQLIKISRLDTVFNIIPTTQESIDFVLMEEIERELQGGEE